MRFIAAFFRGLWRALDALRKVLHLVLLLVIFGAIAAAARTPLPIIPKKAALVLAPSGRIVEELSGDSVERAIGRASGEPAPETRLKDIVDVIRSARDDGRIKVLVLDLENMGRASLPKLQTVGAALRDFRSKGKKVLVWAPYLDQSQYYLAAQADEVYLDPYGGVVIDGYGYFRTYVKGTADKLEVDVNVFKVGDHKTAPEQFTRTDMSAEDREQSLQWLSVLWDGWKRDVATARKLEPEALQAYADQMAAGVRETKGDLAQYALQHGLVNGLETPQEFEQRVIELVGEDEDTHSFNAVDDGSYLAHVHSEDVLGKHSGQKVAVLVASGEIMDGEQSPGSVGGDTLSEMLREARYDDEVEAVVLLIDSPGGSGYASEQIRREVVALRKAGKPVVASMSGVAASGGYYIAAEADRIYAHPTTITGSIGVFGIIPTFQRTLGKVGITADGVGTTVLSGGDRLDRSLTPEVRQLVQSGVEDFYRRFVRMVADARGRKVEEIESVAQGRVWAGKDAKAAGLVDEFGDVEAAIKEAARLAQMGKGYRVDWVSRKGDWRDMLGIRMGGAALRFAVAAGLVPTRPSVPGLDALQAEVVRLNRFAAAPGPTRPLYYCACSVE